MKTIKAFALILILGVAVILGTAATFQIPTQTETDQINCLSNAVTIMHTTTNLTTSQYAWIRVRQGENLGIAPQFYGGASTNTGTVGFKLAVKYNGLTSLITTTTPFTVTSTANGTTVVRDWAVVPASSIGPADWIAIVAVTNNTFTGTGTGGTLTISNVIAQWPAK